MRFVSIIQIYMYSTIKTNRNTNINIKQYEPGVTVTIGAASVTKKSSEI